MNFSSGWLRLILIGMVVAAFGVGSASAAAAWTVSSTTLPTGTTESKLFGVSCTGEICWAVGDYRPASGALEPFAYQTLSGTYALPPTPGSTAELTDVSCAPTNFCMAVGRFVNKSGSLQAFAEKYTPLTGWVLQTLTFPAGNTASEIGSVSCATGSECVAVGDYHNATGIHYLAERWTSGGGWNPETPAEPPGIGWQALTSISCPAKEKCVAVGEYRVSPYNPVNQTMETELFTSGTWSYQGGIPPSAGVPFGPSPGTVPFSGTDSCVSTTECISVGYYFNTTPALEMMAWERIAASPGWKRQSMTALAEETHLHGVYCWSFTTCIAVGQRKQFTVGTALAEELSGSTWSQITLPAVTGASESYLNRDACFEKNRFCSLVGWFRSTGGVISILVERNF